MALYRTKRGKVYWMDFTFAGQRIQESTHTASRNLAKRIMDKRRRDLEEGAAGVRKQERPKLFSVAAEEWIAAQTPKWAPATASVHRLTLSHLLPVFGGKLACDIEPADIGRYQADRLAAGASKRRINMEIGTLRSVLKKSRRWAAIQEDVTLFPEDHQGKGRKLSLVEEDAILAAAGVSRQPSLLPFIVLALETGARFNTIRTLTWGQVEFASRAVRIGHDKTAAGTGRIVPLSQRATATLEHWAAQFPARQPGHYLFPAVKIGGTGRRGPQGRREDARFVGGIVHATDPTRPAGGIKSAWEAARERAGVVARFHDLRHTAASRMMEAGVPLSKIAKILGWRPSTMALMAARYGHFDLEELRQAVEAGSRSVEGKTDAHPLNFPLNSAGETTGGRAN